MFGKIIDQIEKEHGGDAVMGVYVSLIAEFKRTFILQQKNNLLAVAKLNFQLVKFGY